MTDLNSLTQTEEFEVTGQEGSEFYAPSLPDGQTLVFLQGKPEYETDDATGVLTVTFGPHKVQGGDYDGRELRFDRITSRLWESEGQVRTELSDHLAATFGIAREVAETKVQA